MTVHSRIPIQLPPISTLEVSQRPSVKERLGRPDPSLSATLTEDFPVRPKHLRITAPTPEDQHRFPAHRSISGNKPDYGSKPMKIMDNLAGPNVAMKSNWTTSVFTMTGDNISNLMSRYDSSPVFKTS